MRLYLEPPVQTMQTREFQTIQLRVRIRRNKLNLDIFPFLSNNLVSIPPAESQFSITVYLISGSLSSTIRHYGP